MNQHGMCDSSEQIVLGRRQIIKLFNDFTFIRHIIIPAYNIPKHHC